MKLEKVLALSLPISFFSPPSLPLQLNCIPPSLILIPSCPFPVQPLTPVCPHTLGAAAPQTIRCGDPVCGGPSMGDTAGSVRLPSWNWKHPWQQRRIAAAILPLVHKSRKQQHKILLTCSYGNGCLLPAGQPATKGPHLLSKGYCSACARRVEEKKKGKEKKMQGDNVYQRQRRTPSFYIAITAAY